MKLYIYALIAGCLVLITLGLAVLAQAPPPHNELLPPWASPPQSFPPGGVYRVTYGTREQLADLAARYDIWELDQRAGYAILGLDGRDVALLQAQGYRLELDVARTNRSALGPSGYPCYRDVEQLYADQAQIVADHPTLTELVDYGDSWRKVQGLDGYDLLVLRITNERIPGPKPRFFLMANIHARELTTPETAMYFVNYLLDNYGVDPDATWLVDYREIYVVVTANPDGRQLAEQGCYQRKNRNDSLGSCTLCDPFGSNHYGVDLNRNNPYHWGGAGTSPCGQTYQGTAAASEPETYALNDLVRSLFPDQRPADDTTPAPDDATGLLITLHSYGNLVLWPWGWTSGAAPNGSQMQTLGRKLAYFNRYRPERSSELYPTTGDTTDWAYGELGIPAYTFELGESFFQPCDDLEQIEEENLGAFLYAAKVARTPYVTPSGPDVVDLSVSPAGVMLDGTVWLTATVDDTRYRGAEHSQAIAAAEVYVDVPVWVTTTTTISYPMTAMDGAFDEPAEEVGATLDTTGLSLGRHILFVRGRDADGNWGPFSAIFLYVLEPGVSPVIEGRVRDVSTYAPLGATVTAGDFWTIADPVSGYYSMTVMSGTYAVSSVAAGYAISSVTGLSVRDHQVVHQDWYLYPRCDVFTDHVESGNVGWTVEGNWAITTESSHSPIHSWADSPAGNYGNNWNYALLSPPLDLADYQDASLSFWHIYDLEDGWDYALVEVSADGGNSWTRVASYSGEGHTTWTHQVLSLPELDGQSDGRIRFRLHTDGYGTRDGWHVDDIVLSAGGLSCAIPQAPAAGFTTNSPVYLGRPVRFENLTIGTRPMDYEWDFGDGVGVSVEESPVYTYTAPGTFTVTLTASNSLDVDSISQPVVVLPWYRVLLMLFFGVGGR